LISRRAEWKDELFDPVALSCLLPSRPAYNTGCFRFWDVALRGRDEPKIQAYERLSLVS
jgi:hypothetical protein